MRVLNTASRRSLVVLTGCVILLAAAAPARAQIPARGVAPLLGELESVVGGPVRAEIARDSGFVRFMSFEPGRPVPVALPRSAPARERALAFIDDYGRAFGITRRDQLAVVRASGVDEVGMEHVRFRQTRGGVPVTGGDLTVHLRGSTVVAVNARTLDRLDHLSTVPTVAPVDAVAAVHRALERRLGVADALFQAPRLELFNRGLLEGRRGWTRLAWFVEATGPELREFFWVDAQSGAVLLHFSQLAEALDREVYDADDPSDGVFDDLPGTLVRSEGNSATGDADTDAAYDFAGDTYDYFFTEHGRDSYDDAGATLPSTVHFCPAADPAPPDGVCPYANAFWNGVQMVYGEGTSQADDVVAHELTHAVTENTANLFYYQQSGALNESYSDIFGETVDLMNGAGDDTAGVRWQIGEDIPAVSPLPAPLRDMMDPTLFGDPGKMSDAEFECQDPGSDAGGVHSNSGVPNHAYALMVDGGTYNSHVLTGIGLTKAGKIHYRALAYYLGSASDFLDHYNSVNAACRDLVGVAGITDDDCDEVDEALQAVEMEDPWPCTPAQDVVTNTCPAGQAPSLWHSEDMESLALAACPGATVPGAWCLNEPASLLGSFATSGVGSLWGYNRPVTGSMAVAITPAGTLPAGARMQFNHAHGFENAGAAYYDGGKVEYSTNGGGSWSDGGPLITDGQSYGGTVDACCSNPFANTMAFVADSFGYVSSQLDLSGLAGQSFRYRFNVGTDSLLDDYGWFVDDVRIFSCAECVADRVLDASYNGLADEYKAGNSVTAGGGFTVGATESVRIQAGVVVTFENDTQIVGDLEVAVAPCP